MKILKVSFKQVGIFQDGFSFDFTATDRVIDENQVFNLYKTLYSQKIIAVTGPNASGKTTLLKLLRAALRIVVNNDGLDDVDLSDGILKDGTVMIVDFYNENKMYRLESIIGINDDITEKKKCFYKDEIIYMKLKSEIKNKESIFDFGTPIMRRSALKKEQFNFLKPQDSIVSIFAKNSTVFLDTIHSTNLNVYYDRGNEVMPFVNLFDDSIESILSSKDDCEIKFKNSESIYQTTSFLDSEDYLSSGTIKGSAIISKIAVVMKLGGYLVIDEIENHLHKKLVQVILSLFMDEEINKKGATLIFTTHYAEIMDSIERKDNIYVLVRDDHFVSKVVRFSDLIKRNDIKKSDVLLSNYIEGTTPSYEKIMGVKELLCKLMR